MSKEIYMMVYMNDWLSLTAPNDLSFLWRLYSTVTHVWSCVARQLMTASGYSQVEAEGLFTFISKWFKDYTAAPLHPLVSYGYLDRAKLSQIR